MEGTEATTRRRTNGNLEPGNRVLMSSKPLHRFVQREPGCLGIAILMCGCAEVLLGFQLARESERTSYGMYIPFWQGALFLICGNLSIYTERRPSKKMVTVCLAMYLVSFFGILISAGYRIVCFTGFQYMGRWNYHDNEWAINRSGQLIGVECVLFTSSLCVSVLLIFLCTVARLALKSTHTQVIIQSIPPPLPPPSDTTTN